MRTIFEYKGYKFEGGSEGGISTSIFFSPFKWIFDMGYQNIRNLSANKIFLSHSHLDHSMSLPYYLSQRTFRGMKTTDVYVPEKTYEFWKNVIGLYSKMENFEYNYNLIPVSPNIDINLSSEYILKSHKTYHRVDSVGYTIIKKTRKLKKEYSLLSSKELTELKKKVNILDEFYKPIFSFSGDTTIDYVLENSLVQKSTILFLECTYVDQVKTIEQTRNWGHIHLDEIIKNAHLFQNEKIILIHFSKRYKKSYLKETVSKKIPENLKDKIHLLLS